MTFCEQLIVTIVDKGAIALIVLIVGYVLNKALEGYRATQLRETELLKLRLEAMRKCWAGLLSWSADCDETVRLYMNTNMPGEMLQKITSRSLELNKILDENRFFAGNSFISDCIPYYERRMDYYNKCKADGAFCNTEFPEVPDVLVIWRKFFEHNGKLS